MESKQPLLSICIPTYNRSKILQKTIQTIVSDIDFDEDIELIISDNCSTDETKEILSKFCEEHENVFYYRNEVNIRDKNFSKALSYGKGVYLKLQNDNLSFLPGALKRMKEEIKAELNNKTPLFFTGDRIYTKKKKEVIYCSSLDDYVQSISECVTWISAFGAWKEQFMALPDKDKYADMSLAQDDWSYRIVSTYQKCIICDYNLYFPPLGPLGIRRGYNFFTVFIDNYYTIMQPYITNGEISKSTYYEDRKYVFLHFRKAMFLIFVYNYDKNFRYDTSGSFAILWKYFKNIPSFYLYLLLYPFFILLIPFIYGVKALSKIPCFYLLGKKIYRLINDK
jgi:glycosyltransferase involved in cell wall biosynthesis